MEMLARCVATLKPPPELTLSQWADRYRMLSAESSAEPGRWHTDKAPYQREIMDAIGDEHILRVVIMCAAQFGKTELLLNILGYFMAYAPAPILVMQPTLDMGQTFSKDRLAPMIRDTPVLRGLVDVKSRYAGNTILKKNFPGGHITIVGANSATGLASRPIKVLLADEVDAGLDDDNAAKVATIMADAATRGMAIIRIRHRPPDGRATRTLTLDKGRLTEREMTDSAAQDANAVPDGADENEETQA